MNWKNGTQIFADINDLKRYAHSAKRLANYCVYLLSPQKFSILCLLSLFIFLHDFRWIIKTRRGGIARPALHLPAGSGKRLPGPDGRVNLPLSSPSRPSSVNQSKFIHLLKSEGGTH